MSATIINKANIPALPFDEGKAIYLHVSYDSIKARLSVTFSNTSLVEAIEILRRSHQLLGNYQIHPNLNNNNSVLIVDDATKEPNNVEANNGK